MNTVFILFEARNTDDLLAKLRDCRFEEKIPFVHITSDLGREHGFPLSYHGSSITVRGYAESLAESSFRVSSKSVGILMIIRKQDVAWMKIKYNVSVNKNRSIVFER